MPGHMHTKGSLFPLWLDLGMLDEQCPGVLGTVLGYRDSKVEELALPEFTMWMHDRRQRTLGTTGPSPVILMTRKLRKKGKWLVRDRDGVEPRSTDYLT